MNNELRKHYKLSGLDVYGLGLDKAKWEAVVEDFFYGIIEECCQQILISRQCDPYTGEVYNSEYNQCILDQVKVLKEHFEVEDEL